MKKIILFVLAIITMATSCKKHTTIETVDFTMRVGNIYCDDGTTIDPKNYNLSGKTNAVGVIFWVNDSVDVEDKAYIISRFDADLNGEEYCSWSDTLIETGVSTSISAMNGAANTSILTTFENKNGGNFAAKNEALYYKDLKCKNWYLPSAAQLLQLYNNREAINYALQCCEGQNFDKIWYWTSTEDNDGSESRKYNAYIVSLKEGYIQAELKTNFHAVRPVKTIK